MPFASNWPYKHFASFFFLSFPLKRVVLDVGTFYSLFFPKVSKKDFPTQIFFFLFFIGVPDVYLYIGDHPFCDLNIPLFQAVFKPQYLTKKIRANYAKHRNLPQHRQKVQKSPTYILNVSSGHSIYCSRGDTITVLATVSGK